MIALLVAWFIVLVIGLWYLDRRSKPIEKEMKTLQELIDYLENK